ncbi:hypothetical protein [Bradyrhizobium sp. HKCCYLR20261]|uniref:hypothetical protein n=1 Tax=Bradyrhizobium sp. HKCCYLR20261 TaxID=3420760 RepID=UPI003EB7A9D0
MRSSTAFFAGAGTVAIAVAVGLGGGLVIAEKMNPKTPVLEARAERPAPEASPSPTASSYLVATQAAAITPVKVAPAAAEPAPVTPVSTEPAAQPSASPVTAAAAQAAPGAQDTSQSSGPEKVADKAPDADQKSREADRKRTAEQRRAERHRQYVERRRLRREQDLRAVEQAVRDDSTPRTYAAQPVGMDGPRFSFFGDD